MMISYGVSTKKLETIVIIQYDGQNATILPPVLMLLKRIQKKCNIKKIVCDGKDVTEDSEISDAFNTYFTSIGAELASNIRTTNLDAISYIPATDKVFTFSKINVDTVNNLLKTINANKATGPDNIPGRLLKIASDVLSPSLTEIFNKSLSTGSYPDDWKMAKVMPIYKHGKITELSNYRPIAKLQSIKVV